MSRYRHYLTIGLFTFIGRINIIDKPVVDGQSGPERKILFSVGTNSIELVTDRDHTT